MFQYSTISTKIHYLFFIFCFLTLFHDSFGQKKDKERDSVKVGNLTIRMGEKSNSAAQHDLTKLQKIEIDSSNVRVLDRKTDPEPVPKKGDIVKKIATADDTLAKKLADETAKTIIDWRPIFNANGVRGIRIASMAISQDRSVLVFAETTGSETGPNGTRFIAMNTYTWEPMKIFHVDAKIVQARFISNSGKLAVYIADQESLRQSNTVGVIDLETQKLEKTYSLPADTQIADICASPDYIFLAVKNRAEILACKITGDDKTPVIMKCEEPVSALSLLPNRLFIAGISRKHMTLFKLSDCKKYTSTSMELPWNPAQLQFIDSEKNYFLSPDSLEDASPLLVRDGRKISFDGRSGGFAIVTKDKKNIYIGYKVKGKIDCIDAVTADILEQTMLEQIRPQTIGDPLYVFFLDHRNFLFVLDTNGNGYVATHVKGENRWRKAIIFTAKK